ncbi:zinc finger (CCCH type) helicase family protein [Actinidia rufa]|uniref:RNA helicase n=1 Tax=Actinidia rufa TaxID=165716 RepID=A0A7J0GT02_9ERIC|nr:zinc finger (CCCH type) helicase family protein [Actinidia rufa]
MRRLIIVKTDRENRPKGGREKTSTLPTPLPTVKLEEREREREEGITRVSAMAWSPTSSYQSSYSSPFSSSWKFTDLRVMALRAKIVEKIQENRVTLIVGETGCGKSLQVLQFLLQENMEPILCMQSRRFAVVTVARMVAKARNCEVGGEDREKALDPPDPEIVEDALSLLVHICALEKTFPRGRYKPTFYGRYLLVVVTLQALKCAGGLSGITKWYLYIKLLAHGLLSSCLGLVDLIVVVLVDGGGEWPSHELRDSMVENVYHLQYGQALEARSTNCAAPPARAWKFSTTEFGWRNGNACVFSHDLGPSTSSRNGPSVCLPEDDNVDTASLLGLFPTSSDGCILNSNNLEGQKSLVQTFFEYLAIRLMSDALLEVHAILIMNNIRFSQLQVEKLGRESFFFLIESFPFDESSFGKLSDTVTPKKPLPVSKPVSHVFHLNPPNELITLLFSP